MQGESCLLAGGLDLSTLEAAGCVVEPAVGVFVTATKPPQPAAWSAPETSGPPSRTVP